MMRRSLEPAAGSDDRGLGRDGLDGQFDAGGLADEDAAGLERHVPGEPEVLAVDLSGGAEADAHVAERGGAATVEVDLEGDGLGRAVHGQIAHELPRVAPRRLHAGRCEGDRRVRLDIEEVAAREVRVTITVPVLTLATPISTSTCDRVGSSSIVIWPRTSLNRPRTLVI